MILNTEIHYFTIQTSTMRSNEGKEIVAGL